MTSKNTKTLFIAVFAALMLVPAYGMANAQNNDELVKHLPKGISDELKPHALKILDYASQGAIAEHKSVKVTLDNQIKAEKQKMKVIQENIQNKRVIDPQLKDRLETIKDSIIADEELPIFLTAVDRDTLVIMLREGTQNQGWEDKINDKIPKGIKSTIVYSEIQKWDCSSVNDDCDPLHGGIKIREGGSSDPYCTLGLPVKQGSTTGYLSAGHCYSVNDDVHQPYDHWLWDWKIGDVRTGDSIEDFDDCDCAFITDTNSRTNESEIWISSWYSTPIDGTQLPSDTDDVYISGAAGGWYVEEVVDNNANLSGSYDNVILLTDDGLGGGGDSGAPVYDYFDDEFIGTVIGGESSNTYIIVIPWAEISHSTTGLGVSLL